jgi:2-C-methyl-D-erythritol 4-phosphate cytidylyltransferase
MSFSIIITAGGIGKRMGSSLPKQFMEVLGLPILMHTIRRFHTFDPACQVIVTLPVEWEEYWSKLVLLHSFQIKHVVISGGVERYDSVKNALETCTHSIVGVHDGVRPLVNAVTISRCLEVVREKGAVVPTLPLKESLRKVEGAESKSVQRNSFLVVQTPQFFQLKMLKKAYKRPFHSGITDDASLVEQCGFPISITEGNEENIKITTPMDLQLMELICKLGEK